jgi:amphi-Trp domain-containing protein
MPQQTLDVWRVPVCCHATFNPAAYAPGVSPRSDSMKAERDLEKSYPVAEFVEKVRRLADALEAGERFDIQIAGERIYVPARATVNIEHERGEDGEEIEFQIKWQKD